MKVSLKHLFFGIIILYSFTIIKDNLTPISIYIPKKWPKPIYNFKNNPLTEEGFQLGKQLFYDPLFSKDSTISCASCHLQATGFTHVDHEVSHGIDGQTGTRNSLTLQNLAWSKNFMWDGGINHLEVQAIAPITSEIEMNETLENIILKLKKSNKYKQNFQKVFKTKEITGQLVLKALSQYVVSLTTSNSKYDRVMQKKSFFSEKEEKGYSLFKKNCASCHKEPLFTSYTFENNGLSKDPYYNDLGRMKISQNPNDSLKFKVPTLRNVEFTFPYMHDGRFKTLSEVIKHYNSGIQNSKTLAEQLKRPLSLSDHERIELIAFLKTLSDTEFLFNPRYSFPK